MINPFSKLLHPEKFVEKVETKKIVASPKVYLKGVEKYKQMILAGTPIKPIVVFKHPTEDVYAVLNGHHRFYALKELGSEVIDAAVIRRKTHFLFNTTRGGWLQPTPRMTRFIRIPSYVLGKYLSSFVKNPKVLLKSTSSVVSKLKRK